MWQIKRTKVNFFSQFQNSYLVLLCFFIFVPCLSIVSFLNKIEAISLPFDHRKMQLIRKKILLTKMKKITINYN
jgi:hypothetical protein